MGKNWKTKTCSVCGIAFKPASGAQKRCVQCRRIECKQCGRKFVPANFTLAHTFCSRDCKHESQRGSEPSGLASNRGRKPRTYHLRHRDKHGCAADREWRTAIFERDDYTCQICGQRGGRLNADHIKPYKEYPDLRHVMSNGRTLCVECHRKTPTYGWSKYWHGRKR